VTKPAPSKGAAPLEHVLAGQAGLHRGRIPNDLSARILAIAPSTARRNRAAVMRECGGDAFLAAICLSLHATCLDTLASPAGTGDEVMLEPLSLAWGSLRRTEATWRDAGAAAWLSAAGVNATARAVLHDALTLYLHMLGYAAATPVLVETLWAYARSGSEHAPAFVLRASGVSLLDEGGDDALPEIVPFYDPTDPLGIAEVHAKAYLRSTATSALPARPTHAEEIDDDRAGINCDEDGDARPAPEGISPVELAVLRQLARTLDAVPGLREALAERDVVVVIDVPEALSLLALDGMSDPALGLPTGLRRHVVKEPAKGTDRDRRAREFLLMLRLPGAILCLSPDAASHLPAVALLAAEHRLTLAPVDASDVAAAIRVATGAACSPGDRRALDGLRVSAEHMAVCIRPGRAPADCVAHLVRLAAPPAPTGRGRDITLDELHGCREAVAWGREVIRDLQAWREGAPWSSVASGALMAGAPGTGKTLAAQALATTAGIPLLAASLAQWQSVGSAHLGTTLKAMRETFAEAKALAAGKRGCVLLVDECDVFVDRRTVRHAHADYVLEIVNAFLECLDGAGGREGVVVIGTTNDANRVDPAVRRPGRLGRHIEIGLPDVEERVAMMRVRLGDDLPGADLLPVAYRTERYTGAMIEALVEDARRRARHAGRPMVLDDLLAVAGAADEATPADVLDRIAIHEAGHALMASLAGTGRDIVVALQSRGTEGGWVSFRDGNRGVWTRAAFEERVRIMLGGRAAEETLLDSASSGARQDLLTATRMAVSLVGEWGMGGRGLVAVEQDPAMALAADPAMRRDVQDLLDRLYGETLATVRRHAGSVRRIADALVERRRLDGAEVAVLVAEPAAAPVR
jgi:cell division protease FtsH